MSRPVAAYIDLAALARNLGKVRELAPASSIIAVVKANAYGHGAVTLAKSIQNKVEGFAVAGLEEALELYESGVRKRIHLLSGFHAPEELDTVARCDFVPVIHDHHQLEILRSDRYPKPSKLWLKIDTGMHRLGFHPAQAKSACSYLRELVGDNGLGLMSHLACADDEDDDRTLAQIRCFDSACKGWNNNRSLANSAGVCAWPTSHYEFVRAGIMLYGCSPLLRRDEDDLNITPIMSLRSRIIAVKDLKRGDEIGYGADWRCPQDMRVGVVACGYGDGYPRSVGGQANVLLAGEKAQVLGRVSMDLVSIDLRHHPRAGVGDPVELWGETITASEIAGLAGTIPYELLTGVTSRVPRIMIGQHDDGKA